MKKAPGSFRDPNGYVYLDGDVILRSVNECYRSHWEKVEPLLQTTVDEGLVVPFTEAVPMEGSWKTLHVHKLPFISYPYEWSFSQRKAAALLTLKLHRRALSTGLVLKDASAYNIQFIGSKPIFIDHLSFETLKPGQPWQAYKQFCSHFLAPLALECLTDLECGIISRLWIDGIPLPVAIKMLPFAARFRFGLFLHLYLHAKSQDKYADAGRHADKAKQVKLSVTSLDNIAASLERTIASLRLPHVKSEWGDYYEDTNYTEAAVQNKFSLVKEFVQESAKRTLALDMGANTGKFSKLLGEQYEYVLAADIDPLAVDRHYNVLFKQKSTHILPLVINAANPSPALGVNCSERQSFSERASVDCITALALVHHLTITAGIPIPEQAKFFSSLLNEDGILILEFVPKSDSQVKRLLAFREDVFLDYTLNDYLRTFEGFECLRNEPITGSERSMLLLKKTKIAS